MVLSLEKWKDIVYISQNVWKLMELGQDDIKESITYIKHLGIVTGKNYQVYILKSWQSSISQFYISMITMSNSREGDNIYLIMTWSILQHTLGVFGPFGFLMGQVWGFLGASYIVGDCYFRKPSASPGVEVINAFLHWSSEEREKAKLPVPDLVPSAATRPSWLTLISIDKALIFFIV